VINALSRGYSVSAILEICQRIAQDPLDQARVGRPEPEISGVRKRIVVIPVIEAERRLFPIKS